MVESAATPQKSVLKKKAVAFKEDVKVKPETLADGEFDEDESHNQFLAALNAWRGVPTTEEPKTEVKSTPVVAKKSFFANLGGESEWNVNCLP